MNRFDLIAASLGLLVGAFLPAPWPRPIQERPVSDETTTVRGSVLVKRATEIRPCADPGPVSSDAATQSLQREWDRQWQSFEEVWGTPTSRPADWDPEREEARVRAALTQVPSLFTTVDCSFHPCVAVVANEEVDLDSLTSTLGLAPGSVFVGDLWSETREIEVATVWLVGPGATPGEKKWGRRLADRLKVRASDELAQLVRDPDEQPAP